jgi:CelD/BcsL family acetyltransferase involved in cellulose biosynthesis
MRARVREARPAVEPEIFELSGVRNTAALVAEWNALAARTDATSYFQTGDWVMSWWETIAMRPPTCLARWRTADGSLAAIAAVSAGRKRLHRRLPFAGAVSILAGSGLGDADHCGPVAGAQYATEVREWIESASRPRSLLLYSVDAESASWLPAASLAVRRTTCPRVSLDPSTRIGRSRNFAAQLGRFARRLGRAGVAFSWLGPGLVGDDVIDALLDLHLACRRARRERTSLGDGHRALLKACAHRGDGTRGPAAVVARQGEQIVGVLLGFWWRETFAAYQSGWDLAFADDSIGSVLVAQAMHAARDSGAHTFDFLRGDEAYKYRFGAEDRNEQCYLVARGPVGAFLVARARLSAWRSEHEAAKRSPSLAASS